MSASIAITGVWHQGVVFAGTRPLGVAVSPNGKNVYVTNTGTHDSVSQYNVGAGGKLTPKNPATVAAGAGPVGVATNPPAIPE